MNLDKTYHSLVSLSFAILFIGLPLSKFLITLGVIGLALSAILKLSLPKKYIDTHLIKTYSFLIVTYFLLVLSLLWSENTGLAIKEVITQNGIASMPILVAIHWDVFRLEIKTYLRYLIWAVIIGCLTTLIFYCVSDGTAALWVDKVSFLQDYHSLLSKTQFGLYSPYIDRLHFAYIIGFTIYYCVYEYVLHQGRFYFWGGLIGLVTLILLGARGAHLAFLCGAVIYIGFIHQYIMKYDAMKWSYLPIVIISLSGFSLLAYKTIPAVANRYNQTLWELDQIKNDTYKEYNYQYFTTLTRLKSIQNTWNIIEDNAITGIGIGDLEEELIKQYQDTPEIPVHNQNYYLYLWATGGILALICFMIFLVRWSMEHCRSGGPLITGFAWAYALFLLVILTIDVVLKYHIGVFSIPLFLLSISALHYNRGVSSD